MSSGNGTVDGRHLDKSHCLACLVRQAWVTTNDDHRYTQVSSRFHTLISSHQDTTQRDDGFDGSVNQACPQTSPSIPLFYPCPEDRLLQVICFLHVRRSEMYAETFPLTLVVDIKPFLAPSWSSRKLWSGCNITGRMGSAIYAMGGRGRDVGLDVCFMWKQDDRISRVVDTFPDDGLYWRWDSYSWDVPLEKVASDGF
jgi:hypothetical protein